jgi:adenine phosphoribosyltransferase
MLTVIGKLFRIKFNKMMMKKDELIQTLEQTIENISDFPIPGIQFKDITPIFLNPKLYEAVIADLAAFSKDKIDVVCGIESRGYLFGIAIAVALDVPFVLIRKKGKLPPPFVSEKYDLEYGTAEIEMKVGQIKPGQRVLIHDDLLATGGTTEAAAKLVEKQGAIASQFSFLIGLKDLKGEEKLSQFDAEVYQILHY